MVVDTRPAGTPAAARESARCVATLLKAAWLMPRPRCASRMLAPSYSAGPPSASAKKATCLPLSLGDTGSLVPFLQDLGRDHRKFNVLPEHYPAVGDALIATLRHFSGAEWTPELEQNWLEAYTVIVDVMQAAADADNTPATWQARVIGYERRSIGTAAAPSGAGTAAAVPARTVGRARMPGPAAAVAELLDRERAPAGRHARHPRRHRRWGDGQHRAGDPPAPVGAARWSG